METNVSKRVDDEGNETVSFRKSWKEDEMHHSIEVKKVEGGYIIVEEEHGEDEDGKYIHKREEKVSMTNPFKEEKEEKELNEKDEKMFGFIDKPNF